MSKKIVSILYPFDKKQTLFVYEDGNPIDAQQGTMDEVPNIILDLSSMYDVNDISLLGSKQFNKGMAKKIQKAEMDKYNNNSLKIHVE